MNRFDIGESGEVPRVESEDALYPVHMHGGYQPCVMHLDAGDVVSNEKATPFQVNQKAVGKNFNAGFYCLCAAISLRGSQAKSVAVNGPRENVPNFAQVLRGIAGSDVRLNEPLCIRCNQDLIGVVWLLPSKQDIGVE